MPSLQVTAHAVLPTDRLMSQVTDLALVRVGTRDVLVATTRYDGALSAWDIASPLPRRIDSASHGRPDGAGAPAALATLTLGGTPTILTGGGTTGTLVSRALDPDGSLGTARSLGSVAQIGGDLVDPIALATPTGGAVIYAGVAGQGGLARVILDADGRLVSAGRLVDTGQVHTEAVTAMAVLELNGTRHVFAVSRENPGLSAWTAGGSGALTHQGNVTPAQGLWVADPTALATVAAGGQGFVLVAAAGSSSLTCLQVGADGGLVWRDHLIDDLGSRFAGATALAALVHQGAAHVVIGGADDGISLYRILADGRLVARAHLADTSGAGLANVSAITARSLGDRIDIFVTSSLEQGITRLSYVSGPEEQILRDGAGADRLTGGAGADLFILGRDGQADTITDFQPGIDRVDLSLWPALRSLGQMTITATANGAILAYGPERLTILTADGRPLGPGMLTAADLLGDSHVPLRREAPWPGPGPSDPPPHATTLLGSTGADRLTGGRRAETLLGEGGDDRLAGGNGADRLDGGAGADSLSGEDGDDHLLGQAGTDRLWGGSGADRLDGGPEGDALWGGTEADILTGGDGADTLWGEAGNDALDGGAGHDTLWGGEGEDSLTGGAGDDSLSGEAGRDRLAGGDGADRIDGGAENDRLWGLAGADRIGGAAGNDRIWGGAGNDRLEGGAGRDRIAGRGGDDHLWGGAEADRLNGGLGQDSLWGGDGDDRLSGRGGADWLDGGPGRDGLRGGGGNDQILGGDGADRLSGGGGRDRLAGGAGNDRLSGRGGDDVLGGEAGNDRLAGGGGRDSLWGGDGADTLAGGSGNDRLGGGAGADALRGGSGRDRLEGGPGNDRIWGGAGADAFVFTGGRDRILDWDPGEALLLGPGLAARENADWLIDRYGTLRDGDVILDFGGDVLRILDAGRLGLIARAIEFL